jgi:DNA-binding CsgD family transcriptional regulator
VLTPSTVERLFAAVLQLNGACFTDDPEQSILRALAPFFGTDKGVLFHADKRRSRALATHLIGFGPSQTSPAFERDLTASDFIYLAARDSPAGSTHIGSELIAPEVMHSSPIYRLVAVPANVEYMVGGILESTSDSYVSIGFWRAPLLGDFDSGDKNLLASMLPHVRQSLQVVEQLRKEKKLATTLRTIGLQSMERARTGIMFLDARGQIVWLNREATRIGKAGNGIAIKRSRLRLEARGAQVLFDDLLRERRRIAADKPLSNARTLQVRRKKSGLDYQMLVIPLRRHPHQVMLPREAATQVLINDPGELFNLPASQLVQEFGLTLAESRLCEALIRTGALRDAAFACHISMNTARSHLKGVFAKLKVSSQLHLAQYLAAHFHYPTAEDESR